MAAFANQVLLGGRESQDLLVQLSDVPPGRPCADQPAPRRIEYRRLPRGEHGRHGHIHVRTVTDVPKLTLGLDDVALERGAAFGMLNAVDFPFKTVVLSIVAAIALGGVAWYAATVPLSDRLARLGIAGVLGGAVGNLIDRATSGYVLDFVDAYWNGWHFWAFNVADAAITIGVIFMILDILGLGRRASNPL